MKRKSALYKKLSLICLVISLAIFALSMSDILEKGNINRAADKTSERIAERISELNSAISKVLSIAPENHGSPEHFDEDIVVYRYVNDSLVFWCNQFPILNDNISQKMVFHRLSPYDNRIESPLINVTDELKFLNIGTKWYLIKYVEGAWNDKVIAGLEIKNTLIDEISASRNGVNPNLKLKTPYSIQPLSHPEGAPVEVNGTPVFKVTYDATLHSPIIDNCTLRWIAIALLIVACMLFLASHRTFKAYLIVVPVMTAVMTVAYFWSCNLSETHDIFSSRIFSDHVFNSLGELLLINTYIFILCVCTFIIKGRISKFIHNDKSTSKKKAIAYGIFILICIIAIAVYIHLTLTSFINNSSVSLELYKASDNIVYTAVVYLSYTLLLACLPLLVQELRPVIYEITGEHHTILTRRRLIIYAFICAAYFTTLSGVMGFRKEQDKAKEWAEMLVSDRDAKLEESLNAVEKKIADDPSIASFISHEYGENIIINRIKEYYLPQFDEMYEMNATVIRDRDKTEQGILRDIIKNSTPVSDSRHFMFMYDNQGHEKYAGVFVYFNRLMGADLLILNIEPKANKEGRGYHNILSHLKRAPVINIPAMYSFAKYKNGKLTTYGGSFPYPNVPDAYDIESNGSDRHKTYRSDGYVHFITKTQDGDLIVLSRPVRTGLIYFTALSYIFLGMTLLSLLIPTKNVQKNTFRSNYFRTRISAIILTSSFLLLSSMAAVSIAFVYKRNEQNMFNMMKERVSTIQGMLESRTGSAENWQDLTSLQFASLLTDVGNTTKSDITLYTDEGKVFRSTSPDIFESRILSSRIDDDAFYNIQSRSKRFYILEEEIDGYEYWTLYAPLLNNKGEIVAIMCVPYTEMDYDFVKESFFHAALIINAFILLLIITLVISNRIINSMFSPLVEMGKKMSGGNINKLEYIIYKREDEISSLVDAYNRMVKDLSDSTKQLAQAERDKAWSEMARQVAHEIKNPLTPIKLEIQRLIRLKQNNNPKWEEKFEQVAAVVLEHIQILSDTANEFSTFAKLYSEEPVEIDLNKLLKDQIMIYDNKENVKVSYIGLDEAVIVGPKPQIIRVFVNLLNNAIQAVENMQKDAIERGEEHVAGQVMICLRHGAKDGYFDIAFDDNGPGVSKENQSKLFTPNFTTKSGGTGLGLAICRNIIEKCEGEISYQKSFVLGGACFVVSLPKTRS